METDNRGNFVWSRELIFRLIDELKANPLLWDQGHEDFKKRKKKRAVLQRIGNKLQLPEKLVRFKIDVLKATFHRYRRLVENRKRDGTPYPKIAWFAYQRLLFLTTSGLTNACAPSKENGIAVKREIPSPFIDEEEYTTTESFIPPANSTVQQNDANWIPPPIPQSSVPDNSAIIIGGLLKVIEDSTRGRRTWPEAMASYVAVMLQQAGERSPAEMRLFHRKLICLVESFQDGTLTKE
ncbi:uncharacterized protein LOC126579615 [Anopheles aquasalis]|uniref:uncharacterized protein LOC126579615 n=1 Tax=Anopheles aquasalis TaxID=42839 RepID=UPI00215AA5AE|nr:uncharacterized protein LOC126579615 [Anopheles aquasalis]